jgi:hypothetical protein
MEARSTTSKTETHTARDGRWLSNLFTASPQKETLDGWRRKFKNKKPVLYIIAKEFYDLYTMLNVFAVE